MVAIIFNDYNFDLSCIDSIRKYQYCLIGSYYYLIYFFYDRLLSLAVSKYEEKKEIWIKQVEESLYMLKNIGQNAPEKFQNKICLLNAKMAVINRYFS